MKRLSLGTVFEVPTLHSSRLSAFIDDERMPAWNAPDDMLIARTIDEVEDLISDLGMPPFISFDHDLGKDEATGFDIAKRLVELDMDGVAKFPSDFSFYVHSQNPRGKENIEQYLGAYLNFKKDN